MDGQQFDRLTQHVGQMLNRRRVGALLAAAGFAAICSRPTDTDAKKKKRKKKKPPAGCTPDCTGKACGADDGCGGTCQTGSCPGTQVCRDGACGTACDANCRADGSENDQTCPGSSGHCPCARHCGGGWCGDCCVDGHCSDSPVGPECLEPIDPNHAGNYICGCKQFNENQPRTMCVPGEGCSTCCNSGECGQPGEICTTVPPSPFIGRSCCLPYQATCGISAQCCSDFCSGGKCACIGDGQNCGAFEACCSGVCSTTTFKCVPA